MAKTVNLGLPLISPSQAQKHVTVNEALSRLDTVTQLRVVSSTLAVPPADAGAGASYLVPSNASGMGGKGGQIAARSNGGWVFLEPVAGWRVWHIGDATSLVYDGKVWIAGAMAVSRSGASTVAEILEFDHTVVVGATSSIANAIPRNTQVIGVTGCVLSTIRGTGVTGWKVGVAGAVSRFGTGLGLAAGTSCMVF